LKKKKKSVTFWQDNQNSISRFPELTVSVGLHQFQTIAMQILYRNIPNRFAGNKINRAEASCFTSGTLLKKVKKILK